jgi:putative PIN family toxin of toxin-antitoxin system
MCRIVLDTNLIVSAFWTTDGNSAKIIDLVTSRYLVSYYTLEIINEYQEVLSRNKFKFSEIDVYNFLANIRQFGQCVSIVAGTIPMIDETDRKFYDVAKSCDAYLITGNTKHFPNEDFIISPRKFLEDILHITL